MRPRFPRPSSTSFRVFTSGLLSFLLLMSPMATPLAALAAPAGPPASRAADTGDAKPLPAPAQAEAQGVDARDPSAASMLAPVVVLPPPPTVTADLTDNIANTTKVDKGSTITYQA